MVLRAEDNPFPSVLFAEHVDPSNPDAGTQRLFVDTDHVLKLIDSSGTVTTFTGASGNVATDTIWDAKGDLAAGTGANTASKLTVGSNDTILMADSAQSTGLKWVASQTPSTQAFSDSAAEGTADTYARGDHKHGMPASPSGGGWSMLEAHTANNSSANLDFTSFISSTYDTYKIEGSLLPASSAVNIGMRMGTGGGPTYDTGSNYAWTGVREAPGGQATGLGSGSATSILLDASGTVNSTAAGGGVQFSLTLRIYNDSTTAPHVYGVTHTWDGTNYVVAMVGATYVSTTTLTAVRFLSSSGNLTSGAVRIYGVPKT